MIRSRNVAYNIESTTGTNALTAVATKYPVFLNSFPFPVRVKKATFLVQDKGAGGTTTSWTVDLQKNGVTVLGTIPTLTVATVTNYTTKFDTDKTITASAPTGVSALPALSSTASTITLAKGDVLELVVTPNGTSTTGAKTVATVTIEYAPA